MRNGNYLNNNVIILSNKLAVAAWDIIGTWPFSRNGAFENGTNATEKLAVTVQCLFKGGLES